MNDSAHPKFIRMPQAVNSRRRVKITQMTCLSLLLAFVHPAVGANTAGLALPRFDASTVTYLLANIDQGNNAAILKIGYFARRMQHALALKNGFELLNDAIKRETLASKRWFLLQSVRGFAAFRLGSATRRQAFETYSEIFSRASEAEQVEASLALRQAIYEFVFTVSGDYAGTQQADTSLARDLLLKALAAQLILPPFEASGTYEPEWTKAIATVGNVHEFKLLLQKHLDSTTVPPSYALFKTAAAIYQASAPDRSLVFLLQAKALLPQNDAQVVSAYYSALVGVLKTLGKWDEAIAAQKELVQLSGRGQVQLATLYQAKNDEHGVRQVLDTLSSPQADEQEINTMAALLNDRAKQDNVNGVQAIDWAVELLTKYLLAQRERDVEQELQARLLLGQILLARHQPIEAATALSIQHLKKPLPATSAGIFYIRIEQLRERLDENSKVNGEIMP